MKNVAIALLIAWSSSAHANKCLRSIENLTSIPDAAEVRRIVQARFKERPGALDKPIEEMSNREIVQLAEVESLQGLQHLKIRIFTWGANRLQKFLGQPEKAVARKENAEVFQMEELIHKGRLEEAFDRYGTRIERVEAEFLGLLRNKSRLREVERRLEELSTSSDTGARAEIKSLHVLEKNLTSNIRVLRIFLGFNFSSYQKLVRKLIEMERDPLKCQGRCRETLEKFMRGSGFGRQLMEQYKDLYGDRAQIRDPDYHKVVTYLEKRSTAHEFGQVLDLVRRGFQDSPVSIRAYLSRVFWGQLGAFPRDIIYDLELWDLLIKAVDLIPDKQLVGSQIGRTVKWLKKESETQSETLDLSQPSGARVFLKVFIRTFLDFRMIKLHFFEVEKLENRRYQILREVGGTGVKDAELSLTELRSRLSNQRKIENLNRLEKEFLEEIIGLGTEDSTFLIALTRKISAHQGGFWRDLNQIVGRRLTEEPNNEGLKRFQEDLVKAEVRGFKEYGYLTRNSVPPFKLLTRGVTVTVAIDYSQALSTGNTMYLPRLWDWLTVKATDTTQAGKDAVVDTTVFMHDLLLPFMTMFGG